RSSTGRWTRRTGRSPAECDDARRPGRRAANQRVTAATSAAPRAWRTPSRTVGPGTIGRRRRALAIGLILAAVIVAWEGIKWLGGDPWRLHGTVLWIPIDYEHHPAFSIRIATDISLPHLWDIAAAFMAPAQRNGPPLVQILFEAAVFTFREALVGFVVGAALGLALAIAFVHVRLLERALVPYVVASQTVPIIAIAP